MTARAVATARAGAAAHLDTAIAVAALLAGVLLVHLVLFDQGELATLLAASAALNQDTLHELFHDGRHVAGAPCH